MSDSQAWTPGAKGLVNLSVLGLLPSKRTQTAPSTVRDAYGPGARNRCCGLLRHGLSFEHPRENARSCEASGPPLWIRGLLPDEGDQNKYADEGGKDDAENYS